MKRLLIALFISVFPMSAYSMSLPDLAFSFGQSKVNSFTVAMLQHQLDGHDPLRDINTDYIEALAREIGFKPKYKMFADIKSLILAVETKKADIAVGIFDSGKNDLILSQPLYTSSTAVWYRNQSLSHWAAESLTWGCHKGAVYCQQLSKMGFAHIVELPDFVTLPDYLIQGKIDAVLESYTTLLTSVKHPMNTLGQVELPSWAKPQQVRIAATQDFRALIDEIDVVLSRQSETSRLRSANPYHQVDIVALNYQNSGMQPIRYSAWNDAYPLFYRNRDGHHGGYLNDLLTLVEARTAFDFDYVPATEGLTPVQMLKYGEIDILPMVVKGVNNPAWMYVTDTLMSITYQHIKLPGVLAKPEAKIGVLFSDSPTYQYVKNQVFGEELTTYTSVVSLIGDLESGKLGSAYLRHDILEYLAKQRGDDRYVVLKGDDKHIEIAMAVRGDNTELKAILAGIIASVDASDIQRLQNSYSPFNIVYGVDKSLVMAGSYIGASVFILLGLIGFLWHKNLKLKVSIQEREALRSNERLALLQHVIDALPNRIFIHDTNHRLLLTNCHHCQIAASGNGKVCQMRISSSEHTCVVENQAEFDTVLRGRDVSESDVDVQSCPCGIQTINYHRTPLSGGNRDEKIILTVIDDVTRHKEQERNLLQAKNVAQQAVLSRERFLASMSHELRTPIAGMVGLLEMLKTRETNQDVRLILNNVISSADHLHLLVNDILDFSKLEAQQLQLDLAECCLLREIGELLRVHCSAAREKSLDFQVNWTPGTVKTVTIDALRLRQILNNLLSNAIKFTHAGFVRVDINVTENEVLMAISDSGDGMSPELLQTVFNPFVQADSSIARRYGGTGLGLAIVHDLVDVMRGEISLQSEPGKGTRIQVSIPVQAESHFLEPISQQMVHYHGEDPVIQAWLSVWRLDPSSDEAMKGVHIYDGDQPIPDTCPGGMTVLMRQDITVFSQRSKDVVELSVSPFFPDLLYAVLTNTAASEEATEETNEPLFGHVLVAEDNPINQLVISQQLTSFGLSVELVNNGQEAYERLQKGAEQFDLLLTDCHMPVMDGYELATLVREHLPQFSNHAIIGCTAEDSRVANERAMLSGFDSVLYKPYGLQRLYQTVAQFVPKRAENAPANWWQNYEMQDAEMLVEVFITSMNDDLMALQTKRTDRKAIHDLAHRIKGGAGTVGDQKICVAATQLENRSKQGEQGYDAELKQLVAVMTLSINRAEVWLNEH